MARRDRTQLEDGLWLFHAEDCYDCGLERPEFKRVMRLLRARGGLVDCDAYPDLAEACRIRRTPTLLAVRSGRIVGRADGYQPPRDLEAFLRAHHQRG